MFVEKTSVDLSKNKFENITLVWDMNKLFEEFIFELIKRKIPERSPIAQKTKRLLRSTQETRRDTKVDILVQHPQVIIDTKYKKFTNFDDISSADIYQVTTYCTLYGYKKAILLYPQYDDIEPDETGFYINNTENNYQIDFRTIDLKSNDLKNDLKNKDVQNSIIKKIKDIIGN